jgi:iron uptake system EfeUOB component EfeO/EfeM
MRKFSEVGCVRISVARPKLLPRPLLTLGLVLLAAMLTVAVHLALASGPRSTPGATETNLRGPAALAISSRGAPVAAASVNTPAAQGAAGGGTAGLADPRTPISPAGFDAPVAAYRAYSIRQLALMETQISDLEGALAAGNRSRAKDAWRRAFADYLTLGGVYLEGQIANLNQAIDGTAGGLPGGTASPQFAGLHRLEFGLWTGAPLPSLEPWARLLATDVGKLRRALPNVQISPLDYATRAHEILEDAVRDLLSGTDVPWSGEGVLGTDAGLTATSEVIATLAPLLDTSEEPLTVGAALGALRSTIASIRSEHGGSLPTNSQLTQEQSEQLDASIGKALEVLAAVPGMLETALPAQTPQIPKSAVRIDP